MSVQSWNRIHELGALLDEVRSPFVCEGALAPASGPVAIAFPDGEVVCVGAAQQQRPALQRLVERCAPARFGAGTETRLDEAVRAGLQLCARDFTRPAAAPAFEVRGPDLHALGVVEEIRRCLMPEASVPPILELHALNLYGAGGHFDAHKDTPRGPDVLGTLVVCLPSRFSGGELELQRGDEIERIDWAASLASNTGAPVQWAAFFGDVDHRVYEVTSGLRITVTYLLRAAEADGSPASLGETSLRIRTALAQCLEDPEFLPAGETLSFECLHMVGVDARECGRRVIDRTSASWLKGRDRSLAAAALDLGLEVVMAPTLGFDDGDEVYPLRRWPTTAEAKRLPDEVTPDDLECLAPEDAAIPIAVPMRSGARRHFVTCSFSPTGYFGNEGGEASLYAFVALEIVIPPTRQRQQRGRIVIHPKFGRGVVEALTERGSERVLQIAFDDGQTRTILERFVRDARAASS